MSLAPSDPSIQFNEMALNPYPVYRRLRHEAPVIFASASNRTLVAKAVSTRAVKDNPVLFSSNDPTTPMEQAFEAHTLMRKDGEEHLLERNAMMPIFARAKQEKTEIDACIRSNEERPRATPDPSALSVMINVDDPIEYSQIIANIKIAIGGGINEPRDALLTLLYGLLTNPGQLAFMKEAQDWELAFQEGVRWVAPIQVSGRVATDDTMIHDIDIPKGTILMVCQASENHGEEVFEEGHLYNVFRKSAPHQSFASGPHHCMGMHIARLTVAGIPLPKPFERFPKMQLFNPASVKWHGFGFRGPRSLPIRLR